MGSGIPLQATQWGIDVKESTRSNIYEANGSLVWDLYADYVSGSRTTLACAIGSRKSSEAAQHALESSMAALGYGGALAFVTLAVDDIPRQPPGSRALTGKVSPPTRLAASSAATPWRFGIWRACLRPPRGSSAPGRCSRSFPAWGNRGNLARRFLSKRRSPSDERDSFPHMPRDLRVTRARPSRARRVATDRTRRTNHP